MDVSTEHAALHGHHLESTVVVPDVRRAGTVRQNEALKPAIVGLSHGRRHAHVSGDAPEDERPNACVFDGTRERACVYVFPKHSTVSLASAMLNV